MKRQFVLRRIVFSCILFLTCRGEAQRQQQRFQSRQNQNDRYPASKSQFHMGAAMTHTLGSAGMNTEYLMYLLGVECENRDSSFWKTIQTDNEKCLKVQKDREGFSRGGKKLPLGSLEKICDKWNQDKRCEEALSRDLDSCLQSRKGSDALKFLNAYVSFVCFDQKDSTDNLLGRYEKNAITPGVFKCFPELQDRISNCVKEDKQSTQLCEHFYTTQSCFEKYYTEKSCNDPETIIYMKDMFRYIERRLNCFKSPTSNGIFRPRPGEKSENGTFGSQNMTPGAENPGKGSNFVPPKSTPPQNPNGPKNDWNGNRRPEYPQSSWEKTSPGGRGNTGSKFMNPNLPESNGWGQIPSGSPASNGWDQSPPPPPVSKGWGQSPPPPPVSKGWGQAPPPPPASKGWGRVPPSPPASKGWGQPPPPASKGWGQIPPRPSASKGWGQNLPPTRPKGWGQSSPPQNNNGWQQSPPSAENYGWKGGLDSAPNKKNWVSTGNTPKPALGSWYDDRNPLSPLDKTNSLQWDGFPGGRYGTFSPDGPTTYYRFERVNMDNGGYDVYLIHSGKKNSLSKSRYGLPGLPRYIWDGDHEDQMFSTRTRKNSDFVLDTGNSKPPESNDESVSRNETKSEAQQSTEKENKPSKLKPLSQGQEEANKISQPQYIKNEDNQDGSGSTGSEDVLTNNGQTTTKAPHQKFKKRRRPKGRFQQQRRRQGKRLDANNSTTTATPFLVRPNTPGAELPEEQFILIRPANGPRRHNHRRKPQTSNGIGEGRDRTSATLSNRKGTTNNASPPNTGGRRVLKRVKVRRRKERTTTPPAAEELLVQFFPE